MRLWQSVSLCDDEHPKAALRYDAPNPRTAPAIFFSVQLLHRNGAFSRIFDLEGPQPYIRALLLCALARVIFTPKNCQKNGGLHQALPLLPYYFREQRIG